MAADKSCQIDRRAWKIAPPLCAILMLVFTGCAGTKQDISHFFGASVPLEERASGEMNPPDEAILAVDANLPGPTATEANALPESSNAVLPTTYENSAIENGADLNAERAAPAPITHVEPAIVEEPAAEKTSLTQEQIEEVESNFATIVEIDRERAILLREELQEIDPLAWPIIVRQAATLLEKNASPPRGLIVENDTLESVETRTEEGVENFAQEPVLPDLQIAPTVPETFVETEPASSLLRPTNPTIDPYLSSRQDVASGQNALVDPFAFIEQGSEPADVINESARFIHEELTTPITPVMWQDSLDAAIQSLRLELDMSRGNEGEDPDERARLEARLRLLYLAANRHHDAIMPPEEWSPEEKQYWMHQMQALHLRLDQEGVPVDNVRATMALVEMRAAQNYLRNIARLEVRRIAFCTSVSNYGKYVEFSPSEFRPNQEVILYAEVDNFHVDETAQGYVTSLQGSYQIFDMTGRRLADHVFPIDEEESGTWRRDFFFAWKMYMPRNISPGEYTLQLTVEDTRGKKFGQSTIGFSIAN